MYELGMSLRGQLTLESGLPHAQFRTRTHNPFQMLAIDRFFGKEGRLVSHCIGDTGRSWQCQLPGVGGIRPTR